MPALTPEQRAKEQAILYTTLADLGIVLLTLVFAIITLSLTLIGETVRMVLMMADVYSFFVLRAVHRDQLRKFRFGIGKLEQACSLVIGASLVVGSFWVAQRVVDTLLFGQIAASPLGLALAAVVNAVNTLINALGWYAMQAAARDDDSVAYKAQLRSRKVSLIASVIVQTTLTNAVLVKDPVISIWLDGLGAVFVAWIMVSTGLGMMWECAPDLLDHPVSERLRQRIDGLLAAAGLGPEELVRIRTRRSGSLAQVELTLAPVDCLSLAEFHDRVGRVRQMVERHLPEAEVAIVVDARGGWSGAARTA
jgi:divalent metal cation (Fe/Co/Zn/Cd) transporter